MGLAADVKADLAEAFQTDLFDAVSELTYVKVTASAYNPTTGVSSTSKNVPSKGIFDALTSKHFPNVSAETVDSTVIILVDDLSVPPALGDKIVRGADTFVLIQVVRDPLNATYKIALTRAA